MFAKVQINASNAHEYFLFLANAIESQPPERIFGYDHPMFRMFPHVLRQFAFENKSTLKSERAAARLKAFQNYPWADEVVQAIAFVATFISDRKELEDALEEARLDEVHNLISSMKDLM